MRDDTSRPPPAPTQRAPQFERLLVGHRHGEARELAIVLAAAAALLGVSCTGAPFAKADADPRLPTASEIALETGLALRRVHSALHQLVALGDVEIQAGPRGSLLVRVNPKAVADRWRTGVRLALPRFVRDRGLKAIVLVVVGLIAAMPGQQTRRCAPWIGERLGIGPYAAKRALAAAARAGVLTRETVAGFTRTTVIATTSKSVRDHVEIGPAPRQIRSATTSDSVHAGSEGGRVGKTGSSALRAEPEPEQSPACGGDDPEASPAGEPERAEPEPGTVATIAPIFALHRRPATPTFDVDMVEQLAGDAAHSWARWWPLLQRAVGKVHDAPSGNVDSWLLLLTATGVLVRSGLNAAGRAGLRRARRELAENCAAFQGDASLGAEWLFLEAQRQESQGRPPRSVAAAFRVAVTAKRDVPGYFERSARSVERGRGPFPMGVELAQLVRPAHRPVGTFAFPTSWALMSPALLDRVEAIRSMIADIAKAWAARDIGGQIAVEKFRQLARADRLRDELVEQVQRRASAAAISAKVAQLVRAGVDREEIRNLVHGAGGIDRSRARVAQ